MNPTCSNPNHIYNRIRSQHNGWQNHVCLVCKKNHHIFIIYTWGALDGELLGSADVPSEFVAGVWFSCCCTGLASCLSLLALGVKTPLNRALILLLLLSLAPSTFSTLWFGLSPAKSPLWFARCSLRRRRALIRSSADAFGNWRNERISRSALRRRCEVSASGFSGGASWSWSCEPEESWEFTGLRSTRLPDVNGYRA